MRLSGVIADLIAQAAAAPGSSESFQVAAVRLLWGVLGATRTATPLRRVGACCLDNFRSDCFYRERETLVKEEYVFVVV